MLRILALTPRPLYPAHTGGRIRSLRIFEQLAREHHVTLACLRSRTDHAEHFEMMRAWCARLEMVDWHEVPKFTPAFYAQVAAGVFNILPYTVMRYRSAKMAGRLRTLLATGDYDVFVCDFLQPSINCLGLPFKPAILFQHNVETVIREGLAAHTANPLKSVYLRHDALKLRHYERRAASAFDHCIMVSEEDRETMRRRHGVTHTSAIPMAVDSDYFTPADNVESPRPEIVFVGSMDMLANQDAVSFFTNTILPLVRREVPAASLTIVGSNPTPAVSRLAADRQICVTGTVDDVRPYLRAAQLVVVPLRIGGGTRIKIFEAMAMGKPVVSTPLGAEGLPVTNGTNIVLEDSPRAFAAAIARLLRAPAERRDIGQAGRLLVSQYTWERAATRFSEICASVVADVRRRVTRLP
jgi:sugar transferase (PEP-CTERM/EpsH1 system associated)